MSQPLQPSLPQGTDNTVPLRVNDPEPGNIWGSFTVFLSPFEQFCVQRWYIFGLVYFAIWYGTAFVTDLAYGVQQHDIWFFFRVGYFQDSYLHYALFTSWIFAAFIAGLFLALGFANRWQRSIPQFFHTLEQRCDLSDPQLEMEKTYQVYLEDYRRALLYGKWRVLTRPVVVYVVVFCSFIVLSVQFVSSDIPELVQMASTENVIIVLMQGLWLFSLDFFYPLFLMYVAISFIWILGATGLYIQKFVKYFPLRIQLAHPDRCGGFKFLGNFALNMALIILAAATLLGFFSIWRGYSIWSVGTSILLLFFLIVSYAAFFAPVYAVHQGMLKERSAYEDAIANRALKIEEQINKALREGDLSGLKESKEELEVVQALSPDAIRFPKWPYNWRMLTTFFTSQIIPIVSFVVGVSPVASNFFSKVVSFFSQR